MGSSYRLVKLGCLVERLHPHVSLELLSEQLAERLGGDFLSVDDAGSPWNAVQRRIPLDELIAVGMRQSSRDYKNKSDRPSSEPRTCRHRNASGVLEDRPQHPATVTGLNTLAG